MVRHLRNLMLASAVALAIAAPALAQETDLPFIITVDGQHVTGSTLPNAADSTATQIDVKFDGLGVIPVLNVSTVPTRSTFKAGDEVKFTANLNYAAWIERGEIRIFKYGDRNEQGLVEVIAISDMAEANWVMPEGGPDEMQYVLRVYDAEGRYDETRPQRLSRSAIDPADRGHGKNANAVKNVDDRTAVRNIDVRGGAVTVYGRNIPEGHDVHVMGEPVPVDRDGTFVIQRIMPQGSHEIDVKVTKDGEGLDFSRVVSIPDSEWFYVGLADFTAGKNFNSHVEDLKPGDFTDDVYTRGRLAFYLKGKIKGRYLLTAAADTGDQELKSIFKGLDGKDPRQFLKRLDPDDYYAVYGDDSVAIEDAPTKGKFYVRLESGPSHVMWGNFKSNITGTKFLRHERALYGAQAKYRSNTPAPDGGAKTAVDVHAAMPGTVPQRDIFRGTGGSAYFIKHQDVTQGSESVFTEVRNAVTGWVVARKTLTYGTDYEFDYVQGVVLLKQPLASAAGVGTEQYLVVTYEYTPAARDVDGYVVGGRAQQWVGDHIRVGATALKENTEGADQMLYGVDAHVRYSEGTWIEAEAAQSEGPGFGSTYSADGGLTLQTNASSGLPNKKAIAYRLESRVDLADLSPDAKGHVGARYEHHGKGFSSLEIDAAESKRLMGVDMSAEVGDGMKASASVSDEKLASGSQTTLALGKLAMKASDEITLEPYGSYTRKTGATTSTAEQGQRVDAGVKIIYNWDEGQEAFIFGQGTAVSTGTMLEDHRGGVGGTFKLTEHVKAQGQISYGTHGAGANATLTFEPNADDKYYIGYQLDPARDLASNWPFQLVGEDMGTIVAGARHRFNEQWLAYTEDNYDIFGERQSLTQIYGVTYTPTEAWSLTGGTEIGQVFDNTIDPSTGNKNPDFDRVAVSLAVDYKSEDGIDGRIKGEYRIDDSEDDTRDMEAYLLQATLGVKMDDDWRAIASLDAVLNDGTDSIRGGDYAEGSIGFAYRPTEGDRINALAKYTFLYDLPGVDQVSVDGNTASPSQRSHIFSGDVSYDLTPQLTLGGKYGVRYGETRDRAPGSSWVDNQVHLGILRADLHVVHQWDLLLEGRLMWSPTTDEQDFGAIAAIYRHFSDNVKVGLGWNFGRFSDDLRDLTQDDHGVFINVIGKF